MKGFNKGLWLIVLMALVATLSFGCASTKKEAKPSREEAKADWRYHDIVDVNFVKQHVKTAKTKGVAIIDSRTKRKSFEKGYIPTAINIPDNQFSKLTGLLPEDKNTLLIFYSGGPT